MAASVTIRGVDAVMRTLNRCKGEMRVTARESVALTGRALLNGFSGATKIAPKHRNIIKREAVTISPRTGRKRRVTQFGIEVWRNGAPRIAWLRKARTMRDARANKLYAIRNRGLAKKSFWVAGKAAKISGAKSTATTAAAAAIARKVTARSYSNLKQRAAEDYKARIYNELGYLSRSTAGISSVIHRAQRWMEEYCKRQAQKATKGTK